MAARAAWTGAINLRVDESGLCVPIAVRAYTMLRSKSADSFKSLCPCHKQPVRMPKRCGVDDSELDSASLLKGVEISKGDVRELPAEAVDAIANVGRSETLDILSVTPEDTVPLHLGTARYALAPNDKVPGSEQPCTILWNGLHANGLVVITEWVMRSGSRNQLVAIHATDEGLVATCLPYVTDLNAAPAPPLEENETAAQGFPALLAKGGYKVGQFDHTAFTDAYRARREDAIAKALAGEKIEVAQTPKVAAAPDLMSVLTDALASAAPAPKKPAKKAAAKKEPEKVAA